MGQRTLGACCALAVVAVIAAPARAEEAKAASPGDAVRRIEAVLSQPMRSPLQVIEIPLNQVTTILSEDYKIPILFDAAALDAVASRPEVEVSIDVANISLRSALELLLSNAGDELTYSINHEVLLITTHEEAEKHLETRVYRVDDLVVDHSDASWGYDADFEPLIDVIVATVDHESWMANGTGEGEIQPFAPSMLVVTQTRRTHSGVAALLEMLRETKRDIGDSSGSHQEASRRPVTLSIRLDDEVIASCAQVREIVQNALLNSVDWSFEVEGSKTDELFLKVLPDRILVRHAPQVVRQVERMVKVVSPPDQSKLGGNFCGSRPRTKGPSKTGAAPDLAEPSDEGEDEQTRPQSRGEGVF